MGRDGTRTALQLVFVGRVDDEVAIDGLLLSVEDADSTRTGAPITVRLRLPQDRDWQRLLYEMLQRWADEDRCVDLNLRRGRARPVADLSCGRTSVSLDVVAAA